MPWPELEYQMAREDVKIEGIKNLVKNMLRLQKSFRVNIMSKSLRKGANIFRDQAKKTVPFDASNDDGIHIRDDIKVRRDPNPQKQGMNEIMYVRPYGKRKTILDASTKSGKRKVTSTYYWHIVEFKQGARFMTNSWKTKKEVALNKVIFELKKVVDNQIKRFKL